MLCVFNYFSFGRLHKAQCGNDIDLNKFQSGELLTANIVAIHKRQSKHTSFLY